MDSGQNHLRITWVARSFLDYRIPVFQSLAELVGQNLKIIFSEDYVPDRVCSKAKRVFGERAIALSGEWKLGPEDRDGMANSRLSIRFHPGLFHAIADSEPDVVIGDGFFKWTFAALLHRIMKGTPIVLCYERTFHTERNAQWYRTFYRRQVVRLTDAMCCNGKLCGEYSQWLGMAPERITYGHMAADTHGLAQKGSAVLPSTIESLRRKWQIQGLLLLYVGRLIALKGVRQLLRAWTLFENMHPEDITLVLVGDGELSGELKALCRQKNLKRVRFIGPVDYDEIAQYFAAADALIMPSLEDNWSLVVPEAMACGLPILCSEYNGCWPELVKSGENGWVFDPLDSRDILRVLRFCLENSEDLKSMGVKSQQIVSQYSPENAARSILHACQIALARKEKTSEVVAE